MSPIPHTGMQSRYGPQGLVRGTDRDTGAALGPVCRQSACWASWVLLLDFISPTTCPPPPCATPSSVDAQVPGPPAECMALTAFRRRQSHCQGSVGPRGAGRGSRCGQAAHAQEVHPSGCPSCRGPGETRLPSPGKGSSMSPPCTWGGHLGTLRRNGPNRQGLAAPPPNSSAPFLLYV